MIAYIWSESLQHAADQLPSNTGRSSMVHSLVQSLDIISQDEDISKARLIGPDPGLAQRVQLLRYHTPAYVDFLLRDQTEEASLNTDDSDSDSSSSGSTRPWKRAKTEKHGFEHDCPPFSLLPTYALQVASATLTACRLLARGEATIAINWDGGRHHALRNRASGFCYVADVVLGIMLLTREGKAVEGSTKNRRPRVMYIDMDLHYGDGVALAFHSPTLYPATLPPGRKAAKTPQVLTLSVHHSSPTFFPPPTPLSRLPSADTSSPFSLSIPLQAYPSASTYEAIFPSIQKTYEAFRPDYIVLQLGADGLPGDPIGQYGNWSAGGQGGMIWLAKQVKEWRVPLCVLGGGGYNSADTARAWAGATAAMLGSEISEDVPHHDYFPEYAPSFTMGVLQGSVKDENTLEHLAEVNDRFNVISSRIKKLVDA